METFEQAEVALAATLPGYESRPQQQALARAVEESLASGEHLIAEAGCGTGKSFGYLIPAILSGKRVIVSTATKALQDQVAFGDLPFLQANLGVEFTAAILKGRSNYLCLNKALAAEGVTSLATILRAAEREGFTGERDDLGVDIPDTDWWKVSADSDDCSALGCKNEPEGCFAEQARRRAREAQIVVVNHALLFTDLMVKVVTNGNGSMLGEYDAVILDEAHEAEEYASNTLGFTLRQGGIIHLVTQARNLARILDGDLQDEGAEVLTAATALWEALEPGRLRARQFAASFDQWDRLARALYTLSAGVDALRRSAEAAGLEKRHALLARRADGMAARFANLITAEHDELVRWVEEETRRGGDRQKVIKSAPIEVGPYLAEHLWSSTTAILTSATMKERNTFDYISGRLGLTDYLGLDVGTPFSFSEQSVLYVPDVRYPAPAGASRSAWESRSFVTMIDLIKASQGRALLLFTSVAQMRAAHAFIAPKVPYTCYIQGQAAMSRQQIVDGFKADTHSVLFGTRSFFTGVDFQGDTLSLVVMDKLPFPVPTEPVTEARCEAIKARGGNDFSDYVMPVMALTLKQGFGRLIRHRSDRGVVAILDPRLRSKGYGKQILNSLPEARRTEVLAEVEGFFGEAVPA